MRSFLFAFLLFPIFLFGNNQIVITIHGFLVSYHSMKPIGYYLACNGYDIDYWNYDSRKATICSHAQDLVCYLRQVVEDNPGCQINFVAHSIGSIILKAALNLPSCPEEAKKGKAILIAPPNKGSKLARCLKRQPLLRAFAGNKLGCEIMSYTEQEMLSCFGDYPSSLEILLIVGCKSSKILGDQPNDGILFVEETELYTPHMRCLLKLSHSELLKSRASLMIIGDFLKNGKRARLCQENTKLHQCDQK